MRYRPVGETAVYHVICRVVGGERLLGPREREVLRKLLGRVAGFCGVEVLAHCILSNHLHLLVRVPVAVEEELTRERLLERYVLLYDEGGLGEWPAPGILAEIFAEAGSEEAVRWEARLRARMHDLSRFMQLLKQRYTFWYNRTHKRFGTLWAERFRSLLVEDHPAVLRIVAAYIDLNPVRAGLVSDPGDYRWSSYGAAMGGERSAQSGLASVCGRSAWKDALADYRMLLFGRGLQGRAGEQGAIPHAKVMEVLSAGGDVALEELLRCKVRYLIDGAILGSDAFVRRMAEDADSRPRRKARKTLGRLPVQGVDALRFWRRLRVRTVG